jgi:hypothetical protein
MPTVVTAIAAYPYRTGVFDPRARISGAPGIEYTGAQPIEQAPLRLVQTTLNLVGQAEPAHKFNATEQGRCYD